MRRTLPLALRKRAAIVLGRQRWLGSREWLAMELVRDLAESAPIDFHHFLWKNHLGYAATYEPEERFGEDRIHPSRLLLFADLEALLRERGIDPARQVHSVYEVGCSMGYLLRYLELNVFPAATVLEGSDIDEYAMRVGAEHLAREGSRVRLRRGDMLHLQPLMAGRRFDVILCAGVLMYLPEADAARVVETVLRHSAGVVAFAGLAHPTRDNATLSASEVRARDGSFIHNLDAFVEATGGRVIRRRWEGGHTVRGNTIYFVFGVPPSDSPPPGAE